MSGGMAEVIAAHYMDWDMDVCDCGWVWAEHTGTAGSPLIHAAHATHVAEELAKAGYGNIPDALRDAANEWIAGDWAAAFIAVEDDAIVSQASANWLRQRARLLEKAAFNRCQESQHG